MNNKIVLFAVSAMLVVAPLIASADTLTRYLSVGMSGADVSALQAFLAGDPTLYPQGLVTGYYGSLTQAAVSNFQTRNGIDPVGQVGPVTLPVLNLQMAEGMANNPAAAATITSVSVNASQNAATVNWNTNQSAKGVVYYSTSPLSTVEHPNSVDVSGSVAMTDSNLRTSQSVVLSNLSANTTYYFMVYTTDGAGNVSVTWPSTFTTTN